MLVMVLSSAPARHHLIMNHQLSQLNEDSPPWGGRSGFDLRGGEGVPAASARRFAVPDRFAGGDQRHGLVVQGKQSATLK
ncbi:hypothetical protein G3I59_09550 [Amycolatopsis rubida]|uniref:Uncharacterized protein n=1 Tax=Amycolatopsis rubida TaxID=112413 RepID=A0ABX0BSJ4_9PSEU|nr:MULTISPECIES: hypothetical protein [Amycolatopsis]MYW90843.1 hypothetical protein [Amycolatopsis rubida]NEC55826.1 hypothetical protein [Amycolatopsis rubida]